MRTGCWPTGTYCWASFQLHSSTDRDLYIRMLTECLGNVVSPNVGDRTARYRHPRRMAAVEAETQSLLVDQPFATLEMGDSMDSDLLPELSGETWVASALLEELTWDLPTAGADIDLVAASRGDKILQMVRSWVESRNAPPWPACARLTPELRCWRLQVGNLKIDS